MTIDIKESKAVHLRILFAEQTEICNVICAFIKKVEPLYTTSMIYISILSAARYDTISLAAYDPTHKIHAHPAPQFIHTRSRPRGNGSVGSSKQTRKNREKKMSGTTEVDNDD